MRLLNYYHPWKSKPVLSWFAPTVNQQQHWNCFSRTTQKVSFTVCVRRSGLKQSGGNWHSENGEWDMACASFSHKFYGAITTKITSYETRRWRKGRILIMIISTCSWHHQERQGRCHTMLATLRFHYLESNSRHIFFSDALKISENSSTDIIIFQAPTWFSHKIHTASMHNGCETKK